MNRTRKILAILFALAILGSLSFVSSHATWLVNQAVAQSAGPAPGGPAIGGTVVTCQPSVTLSATVALIFTNVGTGSTAKAMHVRSCVISNSAAGIVTLTDGYAVPPATLTPLASFYLAANTPFKVEPTLLGPGLTTTAGNGLGAISSNAGTFTMTAVVEEY